MKRARSVALAWMVTAVLSSASAQNQVFVVDAAGGPGSDFLQAADAVAAAAAGDAACHPAAGGGPGLRVSGVNALAVVRDSVLLGGPGGTVPPPCSGGGSPVPPTDIQSGSLTTLAEPIRTLFIDSPVREGVFAGPQVTGSVGEPTFLLYSLAPDVTYSQGLAGTVVPGSPLLCTPFLAIPPGGSVFIAVPIPATALPPGIKAVNVHVQVAVPGASGFGVLGGSSVLTIIDGAL
ncbi:MAG: hypothetical protein HY812_15310 [Planctomycetes bacterium]|nr:hypothetical protein [Planctomycetota bacterium]